MSYLSRIRINPLRAASRALLSNPRMMHGAVVGGIPGGPEEERLLWRLDSDNPRRPHLLVLTETRPDWSHLVEQAGWPDADGDHCLVRDLAPLFTQLAVGREFAFRVTANPVQNVSKPIRPSEIQAARIAAGQRRSFRVGHRTASAQLEWFLDRTERWGFAIPLAHTDPPAPGLALDEDGAPAESAREVRITARNRRSFPKKGYKHPVVLHTVTFDGRLRVLDTQRFSRALLTGIGPGKAYGCGLLTLAPLNGAREAGR